MFARAYPAVELAIRFMDSEEACDAVGEGLLDLGVVTLPLMPAPQLETEALWDDPLVVMAAPDHPLTDLIAPGPADLARYPAILPETGTYTHTLIAQAFARHGLTLRARLQTNYMETIRMMVTVGLGWSLLPTTLAGPDLVGLDVPGLALHRQLGLVRHRDRSPSRAMAAFCDLLRAPLEAPTLP